MQEEEAMDPMDRIETHGALVGGSSFVALNSKVVNGPSNWVEVGNLRLRRCTRLTIRA